MPKDTSFDIFDIGEPAASIQPIRLVPNQHPSIQPLTYRLAIVGNHPTEDEEHQGKPFIGLSGQFVDRMLSQSGIVRACCFIGNVCQQRPPKGDLSNFDRNGPEITAGLRQLSDDLQKFNPNLVLLLGRESLYYASHSYKIDNLRGSVFISNIEGPFFGRKCLATYHPIDRNRRYHLTPIMYLDGGRAAREARSSVFSPPKRDLITNLTYEQLVDKLNHIILTKPLLGCDIEGYVNAVSCVAFATSAYTSFIVPLERFGREPYWAPDQEAVIWKLLDTIFYDKDIGKVWQNGLYDRFVLQYGNGIVVRGNCDDIMLKWWEKYCEFDKKLAMQTSVLTDEPYYKAERKTTSQQTFYEYCCKDACVTFEINNKLGPMLTPAQQTHYEFNRDCLNILLYAQIKGIRYNQDEASKRLTLINSAIYKAQEELDEVAQSLGAISRFDFTLTHAELLVKVQEICCYKKDQTKPKATFTDYGWARKRLSSPDPLNAEERGRLSILCNLTMNTKSHKKFQDFIYTRCKLPTQYTKDLATKEMRVTTNYEALLKLTKKHDHPALSVSIMLALLLTRSQMLSTHSIKGRMHCSYNIVGSETGRVTSSRSVIPSWNNKRVGTNMQTVPDDWDIFDDSHPIKQGMRDLYLADVGCYIGKLDLKGADGWTIGAYLAYLGDPTMLDDLKAGLKPAQIVAYILRHGAAEIQKNYNNREVLRSLVSCIGKEDWEYFVSKQGIWGTCYTMRPRKLAEIVFIQSEGKVNLSEKQAGEFQAAISVRYRIQLWHAWMTRQINSQPYPFKLESSVGLTRTFYNRKSEILGETLSQLPQVYTTYVTMRAAQRLWNDPDNRLPNGDFRIEPLHQVHDELVVQWRITDTGWVIPKLKTHFNNPIKIANQVITIPFSGSYGTSWSMNKETIVGEI